MADFFMSAATSFFRGDKTSRRGRVLIRFGWMDPTLPSALCVHHFFMEQNLNNRIAFLWNGESSCLGHAQQ